MTLDRKSAKAYLLGLSGKSETEIIERLLLEDEKAPEILFALENELIEDYIEGILEEKERLAFESHFLDSEERREQVKEIAMLKRLASGEHRAVSSVGEEPQKSNSLSFWLYLAVIVIALALVIFAGWRFFGPAAFIPLSDLSPESGPPYFCKPRDLVILTV